MLPNGRSNNVGFGTQFENFAPVDSSQGRGPYKGGDAQFNSGAPFFGGHNNNSGGFVGPNNNGHGYPMANNGGYVKSGNVKGNAFPNVGNGNAFHQGGVPNPNVQQPGAPIFGPPNSTPCANGTTAWCKRCGFSNDIGAHKCDQCNLQLLVGGYPSEPPPGNNGAPSVPGGAHYNASQQSVGAQQYKGIAQQYQGAQQFNGGAQHSHDAQQFKGSATQYKGAQQFSSGTQQYKGGAHLNASQQSGGQLYNGALQFNGPCNGGGKANGKGVQVKWCQDCGQQNPHYHKWCNTCHAQLPHSGKGNGAPHVAYAPFQSNGPNYYGAQPQPNGTFQKSPQQPQPTARSQQPHNLDSQRFSQETSMYPGRIPRCFAVTFESGNYIAPVNLSAMAQWKANCEYLNHIKSMQSKIDNYKQFLKEAETKLIGYALPAWKHHKDLEETMQDLPSQAKGLHVPPLHLLAELCFDQIEDDAMKTTFENLMIDILKSTTPATPRASHEPADPAGLDASAQGPAPGQWSEHDEAMGPVDLDDSFEIPQFQGHPEQITDPNELEYMYDLLDEPTPQLPKRQRIFGKTCESTLRRNFIQQAGAVNGRFVEAAAVNTATLAAPIHKGGKGKGVVQGGDKDIPITSEDNSDSESRMTKREKKQAAVQRKRDAIASASTSSPNQSRKTISKPKKF